MSATADGALWFEVRCDPRTRVAVIVGSAVNADGKGIVLDDPLAVASMNERGLRGTTGDDGRFRTRMLIDPPLRNRIAGRLYVQGATLLPNDAGCAALSPVVEVPIEPVSGWPPLIGVGLAAAALAMLAFLPAAARAVAARGLAAATLAAAPVLLAAAYFANLLSAPPAPTDRTAAPFEEIVAWIPPLLTALLFASRRALPSFGAVCAMLAVVIACVPAQLGSGRIRPAALADAAAVVLLLDLAGGTRGSRLFAALAQAAVVVAYPLVRLAWTGPGELPLAASLAGVGVAALVLTGWNAVGVGVLFLATAALSAIGPVSGLHAAGSGWPDVRRVVTLLEGLVLAPGWLALAVPAAATILVAALLLRGARSKALAVMAAAATIIVIAPIVAMLGTPGYFPTELSLRLDGVLVASLPLCAVVLVVAASKAEPRSAVAQ